MSIAAEISRIQGLRNSIRTKLISLGLLSDKTADLSDCTDSIESIEEVTPYLMQNGGATNVAGYKYAQIDTNYWQPIGATPSGIVSSVAYLGANGIENAVPVNTRSIGNVDKPANADGMRTVNLQIDTDVIKPINIVKGVSILGVHGEFDFMAMHTGHAGRFSTESDRGYVIDNSNHWIKFPLFKPDDSAISSSELSGVEDIQWGMVGTNYPTIETHGTGYYIIGIEITKNPYTYQGVGFNVGDTVVKFRVMHSSLLGVTTVFCLYVSGTQLVLGAGNYPLNSTTVYTRDIRIQLGSGTVYHINTHNILSPSGIDYDDLIFYEDYLYHIDLKYV